QRTGDVTALYGNYRGWAGLGDGFPQAAEGAMWQQEGWDWFDYDKTCRVLATDSGDDPAWMELCIDFVRPDGSRGVYEARVEIERKIETFHTTGDSRSYAYAQYGVSLREISTTQASFEANTHPGQRYP